MRPPRCVCYHFHDGRPCPVLFLYVETGMLRPCGCLLFTPLSERAAEIVAWAESLKPATPEAWGR